MEATSNVTDCRSRGEVSRRRLGSKIGELRNIESRLDGAITEMVRYFDR